MTERGSKGSLQPYIYFKRNNLCFYTINLKNGNLYFLCHRYLKASFNRDFINSPNTLSVALRRPIKNPNQILTKCSSTFF